MGSSDDITPVTMGFDDDIQQQVVWRQGNGVGEHLETLCTASTGCLLVRESKANYDYILLEATWLPHPWLSPSSPLTHPIHWTHICSIEAYGNTANTQGDQAWLSKVSHCGCSMSVRLLHDAWS